MKTKTNNDRLRELMKKYNLTRLEVCEILRLGVMKDGQTPAVTKWLANPDDAGNFRAMPDLKLEMLEYRLGERPVDIWKRS